MLLSLLKSVQARRIAARNLRILSALDDEMRHDIGLDQRTLRAFCENGCAHVPLPPRRPEAPQARPAALTPAFR